ncbi:uncharacterized protein LACBIDRAFT_296250 [Laccaria bicolor S238N-H82]|uniref:Predicted protein n=1 Tax=Laccaria bicolor (strain S238N-H82 / ATCC MYA-4686) TaxID=486041 RepID=B0D8B7_LACBS|nr:uncharacterized protein LACBIDRAFT_296250 [Laccaria bicolor S238N-H82]EDR08806.1 predicted protein [Laccaria bicolor S238N-H82]|eukprot:XP_001880119.1 predicted protein [Laccaria bicolor S238N-H82]
MAANPNHRQIAGPDGDSGSQNSNHIGRPTYITSGQFQGQTIRVELEELQKAERGRKYARVDRRPLDPPPAVLLRVFEVNRTDSGRQWEREIKPESIRNIGIMCTVDLFPVPESLLSSDSSSSTSQYYPRASMSTGADPRSAAPLTYFPLHPYTTQDVHAEEAAMASFHIPRRQPLVRHLNPNEVPKDVVFRLGNHLVTESSKLTPALVGEKFVEPTLVEHKGKKALVFVFGDLAIQREGSFILRYRALDIFTLSSGSNHPPILAELYGGSFKVYSTREFPGLEPSTELTRNFSNHGVRVTLRDAERKSKKRPNRGPPM